MASDSNRFSCEKAFMNSSIYKDSKYILIYFPIKSEPDTLLIIKDALDNNKFVFLPKVLSDDTMNFYKIDSLEDLSAGSFGISEPETDVEYNNQPAICIVPGLAFDGNGNRLGYGKGYYDRFLYNRKNIVKAGFCPECNYVDSLPSEDTDITMDYIIVDDKIIRF